MKTVLVTLVMGGLVVGSPAHANDYGCRVLLCLSNPGGPMEYSECVPPITRLYRDLARGRPMPTCPEAGFNGGSIGWDAMKRPVYVDLSLPDGVKRVWIQQAQ